MMDVLNGYRDSHKVSSDEDSEDSDKECTVWKRAPAKKIDKEQARPIAEVEEVKPPPEQDKPTLKRKRNTIWSEVLQDQLMSEDLEDCLLKNKPRNYGSRGKESYDYTLSRNYQKSDNDSDDSHMSDDTFAEEEPQPKKRCTRPDHSFKKFVELSRDELTAAQKINKVLNEKKFYLIKRIVKTVGIEKATKLLSMTEQIEETGGMMVKNNARRRTPGGVYIQLLKNDNDITQDMLDKIFEGEMSAIEMKNFYKTQRKRKKRFNKSRKMQSKGTSESNEVAVSGTEPMEGDEMVPMDAEVINDVCSEKSNLNNALPMPVQEKTSTGKDSDLEEGEIED